jgi:allantoate deiminase
MRMIDFGTEAEKLLKWLGQYGQDPKGGLSRFLYTPEWLAAQQALAGRMREEGLAVRLDEVGNLFGRLEGSQVKNETIMTGSHLDSVRNGGLYDGQYGIIAGLIAVRYLQREYGQPLRNIEVVAIAEEEGSRFPFTFWGSKNIFALAKRSDVEGLVDFEGRPFVATMRQAGFDFRPEPAEVRQDLKAFFEIHIEQGGVLEIEGKSVGVVQQIVGQRRFTIEVSGEANHAGTTPMRYRKDAMEAASRMIAMLIDTAKSYGDPLVATVGRVEIRPNVVNVVPGKAIFSLDARHTEKAVLGQYSDEIAAKMRAMAEKAGLDITIDMWMDTDPVPMDKAMVEIIRQQCEKNGLDYKMMHSGAGHDAQIIAKFVPTAMLFVPSHKGISHSPSEYTASKDLTSGIRVLIDVLYQTAYLK